MKSLLEKKLVVAAKIGFVAVIIVTYNIIVTVISYNNFHHYIFIPKIYSSGLIAAARIHIVASLIATTSKIYQQENLDCRDSFRYYENTSSMTFGTIIIITIKM
jgi:hypothetical protein